MQSIRFYKYQGTGNDFILIDNRQSFFTKKDTKLINHLCNRHTGIGADGLILLENHDSLDFTMVYYNADGKESTMCGNGGRCLVQFAAFLNIIIDHARFEAVDGLHTASILPDGKIKLQMQDVTQIELQSDHVFTDTGSPHHVQLTDNLDHLDLQKHGSKLRHELYGTTGANINYVEPVAGNTYKVRTYERGVEAETLSCGTGVTAVAIAMHATGNTTAQTVHLETPGGLLEVSFLPTPQGYRDVWLTGAATQVFKGEISL